MAKEFDRKIVFEDGSEYYGYSFGARADRVCEAVFNTSPVGYQEIVSDPSYTGQLVAMTYPSWAAAAYATKITKRKSPRWVRSPCAITTISPAISAVRKRFRR